MNRKQNLRMMVMPLFIICALVGFPARAQRVQQVQVINGAGNPVPTAAQGTTNVAGTVNVGNTPSVNVANNPAVTLAPGAVVGVNSPPDGQGNPTALAVTDAYQPYEDDCSFYFSGTDIGSCEFRAIPSGKQLVVQEFDAEGYVETGLRPLSIALDPPSGVVHYFPGLFMGNDGSYDYYATHQETRLYMMPNGFVPGCFVTLTGNSTNGFYICTYSGYLLDQVTHDGASPAGQHQPQPTFMRRIPIPERR